MSVEREDDSTHWTFVGASSARVAAVTSGALSAASANASAETVAGERGSEKDAVSESPPRDGVTACRVGGVSSGLYTLFSASGVAPVLHSEEAKFEAAFEGPAGSIRSSDRPSLPPHDGS